MSSTRGSRSRWSGPRRRGARAAALWQHVTRGAGRTRGVPGRAPALRRAEARGPRRGHTRGAGGARLAGCGRPRRLPEPDRRGVRRGLRAGPAVERRRARERSEADEILGPGGVFGFSAMLTERSVGPRAVADGEVVVARIPARSRPPSRPAPGAVPGRDADTARRCPGGPTYSVVDELIVRKPLLVDHDPGRRGGPADDRARACRPRSCGSGRGSPGGGSSRTGCCARACWSPADAVDTSARG